MLTSFVRTLQLSQEAERLRRSQAEASSSIDAENLLGAAAEAVRSVSDDIVARRLSSTEAGTSGFEVRTCWLTPKSSALSFNSAAWQCFGSAQCACIKTGVLLHLAQLHLLE